MKRTNDFPKQTQPFGLPDIGIPAEVLFHPELSHTEKILFGFLRNLSQSEKGCWASNRWLGGLIGVKGQTISNGIAKLKDWEYILVEYERTPDGRNVRRVFINPDYPRIYRDLVTEGYKNLNNPLLENLYPSIKKLITPYKKVNKKEERKNEREDGKESSSSEMDDDDGKIKPSHFEDFWQLYPKKDSKGAAKKAWMKLCNRKIKNRPSWEEIESALAAQKKSERWQDKQFIPLPTTWLNQERWEDDPDELVSYGNNGGSSKQSKSSPKKDPKEIFQKEKVSQQFIQQCYEPAKQLLNNTSNGELPELAENLIDLRRYIKNQQDKHRDRFEQREQSNIFLPPNRLIEYYIDWIQDNHWIDDREPRLFTPKYKLFQKFLQYQRKLQNDRHPLTGE